MSVSVNKVILELVVNLVSLIIIRNRPGRGFTGRTGNGRKLTSFPVGRILPDRNRVFSGKFSKVPELTGIFDYLFSSIIIYDHFIAHISFFKYKLILYWTV